MTLKATILGSGTSGGVPRAPLQWGACDPNHPKNRRSRASLHIETGDKSFVIDTSPDFRNQMLDNDIKKIDAVLYTHDHADHTHGIDDLRGYFYQRDRVPIPVYGAQETLDVLKQRFDYIFEGGPGYPALCTATAIRPGAIEICGQAVQVFHQQHGSSFSYGYRLGDIAYSTDLNHLDDAAFEALAGVKVWIVDALRYEPHPSHPHLDLTLSWIERVRPERAILTHMAWEMDFETLKKRLPKGIEPGFDGFSVRL